MMERVVDFALTVFTWIGFLVVYVGAASLLGKLLKRARVMQFGDDDE